MEIWNKKGNWPILDVGFVSDRLKPRLLSLKIKQIYMEFIGDMQ